MDYISIANKIFSFFVVFGGVIGLILLIAFVFFKEHPIALLYRNLLADNKYTTSFILVLGATLGSLFYSYIAGYPPCELCWIQRIFLFPQVLILGVAIWKKDDGVSSYIIPLSLLGAIVAGYQHLLQVGVFAGGFCEALGSVSCEIRYVYEFGFVTIPLMAFIVFSLSLFLMLLKRRSA